MTIPILLDAFCGAGGATKGYQRAGFRVVGVDIEPQPNYCGDDFVQGDAIAFIKRYGRMFAAVHASPPCQYYSNLNAYNHCEYPDLIPDTREALKASGRPWVIENVPRAPLIDPVTLCGQEFGLLLYRPRKFESPVTIPAIPCTPHVKLCSRNGYLPTPERPYMSIHGGKHSRAWQKAAAECMGVEWMIATDDVPLGIREVCEAIPPVYTEYVGNHLTAALQERAA